MGPTLRLPLRLAIPAVFSLPAIVCPAVFGQGRGGGSQLSSMERLTLVVSVREVSGQPLGVQAIVRVSPELNGGTLMQMTHEGAIASFPNMSGGGYEVEVQAAGYKTAHEQAELVGGTSSTVYVYMTPEGAPDATSAVDQRSVVTPKLQRGLERALEAILEKKYDEGRKHLILASKMAPANP